MRTTLLYLLLSALPVFAQDSLESDIRQLLVNHQYPEVIIQLEGKNLSPNLNILLVKAYRETGQISKALALLNQMWADDTTARRVALNLGETYYSRGQYRQAYEWFSRLSRMEPNIAYYHKLAGKTATQVASLKGVALAHYQQAMQIEPNDRDAAYALALLYFEFGQNLSARPITQRFVARDSSDLGMLLLDSRLAYLMEQYEDVTDNVSHMLNQGDTIASAIRLYGVSHYKLRNFETARTWLNYLVDIAPSEQVYFFLGMSHYRLESYDTAAVYLQKAIDETQSPNLGDFYTQLALTLDKSGKYKEALITYLKAYELTESTNLLFRMALIYDDEMREYDKARKYYEKFLQLNNSQTSNERLYAEDRLAEMKRADFMNVDD